MNEPLRQETLDMGCISKEIAELRDSLEFQMQLSREYVDKCRELRELYDLDTNTLRAERDEARAMETDEWRAMRKDRDGLQMQVDLLRGGSAV